MTPPQSTSTMVSNIRPNATTTTTTTNNNTTTNHANNHNEREKLGYEPAEPSRRFKTEDFSVNSDQESRSDLELNHNSNQDMASLSSHSGRSLSQQQQSQAARDEFVQSDTRNVRRARWIVYGTLVVVALGVGLATYYLSQQQQQQQEEEEASTSSFSEWEDLLTHHIESVIHQTFQDEMIPQLHRTSKLLTSEGLLRLEDSTTATTATTTATTATSVWPEVTLKHFDLLINTNNGNGNDNGNFDLVAYAPIVWNTSRWEAYTNATVYPMKSRQPVLPDFRPLYSAPLWQVSSPTTTTSSSSSNRSIINMDLASHPIMYQLLQDVDANDDDDDDDDDTTTSMAISSLLNPMIQTQFFLNDNDDDHGPQSILAVPIHENFSSNSNNIVGFVLGIFSWNTILEAAVEAFLDEPHYIDHLHVVLQESCGSKDNNLVLPLLGKQQEDDYLISGQTATFQVLISSARCHYSMTLGFVESSSSSGSGSGEKAYAFLAAALVFGMVGSVYAYYDCLVQRRHKNLSVIAQRTASMLSSLFPKDVQRRIMAEAEQKENTTPLRGLMNRPNRRLSVTGKMTEFLDDNPNKNNNNNSRDTSKNSSNSGFQTKPIADLFPEATIVFADLVGFTAWSSMREPCQVFTLLETLYHAFDEIARRRRVFKVETVGDCYVAVAGLPEPCVNHAQVMARFAFDCRYKMNELVKELEVTLGPDTTELAIRIGLHSGPVTAGVLRGDRARFQLFGDTVNTTSRLESTGKPDKIHVSQECAELLIQGGKEHWLTLREDKVTAKGKGELTTYWLAVAGGARRRNSLNASIGSNISGNSNTKNDPPPQSANNAGGARHLCAKHERLVNWITNELANLLKKIKIQRLAIRRENSFVDVDGIMKLEQAFATRRADEPGKIPLDEVEEIITLPKFEHEARSIKFMSQDPVQLQESVLSELHTYIHTIATMYDDNPFHNFEHASHVTMSVVKLLSRIIAPDINFAGQNVASTLHDHTFGITSDPLTQFATVLSALIHDADHPGVPNSQLIKEKTRLASFYKAKSIAEQNSVDLAWTLLMDDEFTNLRAAIYRTEAEFKRFRQLIVNTVMATDIMDKDLGAARKARWNKAFLEETKEEDTETAVNRKATIVIEHIIQASDIAHTMQHWHIYRKWNGRLFEEMYKAYIEGRAGTENPAAKWYEGEIGFFDFYIIPLAKKLKNCGVFGVSSDEYLNYALQNRKEWELNGVKVVEAMIGEMRSKHRAPQPPQDSVDDQASHASGGQRSHASGKLSAPGFKAVPVPVRPISKSGSSPELTGLVQSVNFSKQEAPLEKLPDIMKVLVVDDDKITRKMFARGVKKIVPQWIIQEAASGEEALEVLASNEANCFDLIFMDHYMGTDNKLLLGSDAVAEARKRGIQSKICGMSANDVEELFDDAGADEFIFKPLPFRPEPLTRELLRILSNGDDWGGM